MKPSVHAVHWSKAVRLVGTRFPRIELYGRLADSRIQPDLFVLEERTNPRKQLETGDKIPLRRQDSFLRNASSHVKASFSYLSKSRFGNGQMPVMYAAHDESTALAEKLYHRAIFLKTYRIPPSSDKQLSLVLELSGDYHDLRGLKKSFSNVYDPVHYRASQTLGWELWNEGSEGIVYDSVRRKSGECVAVFSPQTVTACVRGPVYEFHWDGQRIADVYRLEPRS